MLKVGDIVTIWDDSWSFCYDPNRMPPHLVSEPLASGANRQARWRVLASGEHCFPANPSVVQPDPPRNDTMLAEVDRPERIAFIQGQFCKLVDPPIVTVHVPKGVKVEILAPKGVEVRTVRQ